MTQNDHWLKISFIVILAGLALLFIFPPALYIRSTNLLTVVSLFTLPVFFLAAVLIPCGFFHGKNILQELHFELPGRGDLLPALSAIPIFFLFGAITFLRKKLGFETAPQALVSIAVDSPDWLFFLILFSAGVLAPVSEELAFRRTIGGFFQVYFPENRLAYYFVPSLIFAVCHGLIWQSVQLFFFALYLQWHYQKSSISRVILIHAVLNWCSLTALVLIRFF